VPDGPEDGADAAALSRLEQRVAALDVQAPVVDLVGRGDRVRAVAAGGPAQHLVDAEDRPHRQQAEAVDGPGA
jgi:hypothetical protein